MFRFTLSLVGVLICFLCSAFGGESGINEFLRKKIENRRVEPLKAENELIYCVASLSEVYENRIFTLAWENKEAIKELLEGIEAATFEGLNPRDYHFDNLLKLYINYTTLSPLQIADLDLLATDAFLLYTSHLFSGKVNPNSIDPEWYVNRRDRNSVEVFEQAILENRIAHYIQESLPKHSTYLGLRKALGVYSDIKEEGGWTKIPEGETLKLGDENDRILLVKERLILTQDFGAVIPEISGLFDQQLVDAVIHFQKRNLLEADGNVGKATLTALNIPVENLIDQIKANMERWRWLPQDFGNYYVLVNIANFTVEVFKNGTRERLHKAIVGKNFRRTPVFSAKVSYLVLNPTWTVPPSIIKGDVIPAVQADINYLKSKNLLIYDQAGNLVDPTSINWKDPAAKSFTYHQPAGPNNALGVVKFMFPNTHSVYLHDTPGKDLFEKEERSFSSGCIRVQNPLLLAEYLLNDQEKWSLGNIEKAVNAKKTLTIPLPEQPDIHILYWSAWVNEDGVVQFRKDIYDRDPPLLKALKTKK